MIKSVKIEQSTGIQIPKKWSREQIASNILQSRQSDQIIVKLISNMNFESLNVRFGKNTLISLVPSISVLQFFILKLADINFTNVYGESALFDFASRDIELFRFVLEIGADVNIKSHKDETILLRLIKTGNIKAFKLLLERDDLDLDMSDSKIPPLYGAIIYNRPDMFKLLLERGAA